MIGLSPTTHYSYSNLTWKQSPDTIPHYRLQHGWPVFTRTLYLTLSLVARSWLACPYQNTVSQTITCSTKLVGLSLLEHCISHYHLQYEAGWPVFTRTLSHTITCSIKMASLSLLEHCILDYHLQHEAGWPVLTRTLYLTLSLVARNWLASPYQNTVSHTITCSTTLACLFLLEHSISHYHMQHEASWSVLTRTLYLRLSRVARNWLACSYQNTVSHTITYNTKLAGLSLRKHCISHYHLQHEAGWPVLTRTLYLRLSLVVRSGLACFYQNTISHYHLQH